MSSNPEVSIIIPAKNEELRLGLCLDSIRSLKADQNLYEVIVIDNGSTDRTVEIARQYGARVEVVKNVTIAKLRNYGAAMAKGRIFAFVDSDCILSSSWLEPIFEEFKNNKVGAIGSNYQLKGEGTWVERVSEFQMSETLERCETNWIQSGNLVIKREVFDLVSGFDEKLRVCEDSDICYRIKDAGYSILSNKKICSYHLGFPVTLGQFIRKEFWYGSDILNLCVKHSKSGRYLGVLSVTAYYLLSIVVLMAGILLRNFIVVIVAGVLVVAASFLLAVKNSFEKKDYRYVLQLTLFYFLFGLARSASLMRSKIWLNNC